MSRALDDYTIYINLLLDKYQTTEYEFSVLLHALVSILKHEQPIAQFALPNAKNDLIDLNTNMQNPIIVALDMLALGKISIEELKELIYKYAIMQEIANHAFIGGIDVECDNDISGLSALNAND